MEEPYSQNEIKSMVESFMDRRISMDDVREIVETGKIPRLKGAGVYYGKVRANFYGPELVGKDGRQLWVMITTDNLSTHDKVRGIVPLKGQMLNEQSNYMLEIVEGTLPSSQISVPGPNVIIAERCEPLDVEFVFRKYMAKSSTGTSLYYHYVNLGEREFCGHKLPEGLRANERLPYLMDTPSTKVREGEEHDISVAPVYLFEKGIISPEDYVMARNACMEAFGRAAAILALRGLILVDTKFEVGRNNDGVMMFIDEVLTPDASRYWLAEDYEEKFAKGESLTSFSKQLARDIGIPGEPFTEEEIKLIAARYIEAHHLLLGKRFVPDLRDPREAVIEDVNKGLDALLS